MKLLTFLIPIPTGMDEYHPIVGTPEELGGFLGAVGEVPDSFESGIYDNSSADTLLNACVFSNETNQRLSKINADNIKGFVSPIQPLP